ncbi:hypothetical protein [Bacillus sp. REN10]|uniref:hypothetical protein n=1 Tax=Bacillus sp. REN10 TaxID=2782541 RepID=UPI00193C2018|nr:hypothetical protein [Bacillus sp. REN10]
MLKVLGKLLFGYLLLIACSILLTEITEALHTEPYIYFKVSRLSGFIFLAYSLLFAVSSYLLVVRVIDQMKSNNKKKDPSFRSFLLWAGGAHLLFLPFVYLAMHHSITITEEDIRISPFWDLDEKRYSWEAVDFVELDYEYDEGSHYGSYGMYFINGESWELWDDDRDVFSQLLLVDQLVKQNGVEKELWNSPYWSDIEDWADGSSVYSTKDLYTLFNE